MKHDKIILGDGAVFPGDCSELNNNVLVVGGPGSGKTTSVSEPMLLNARNASYVVSLSKNKLYKKYKRHLEQQGYDVRHIDFSNPANSTDSFNPLATIKNHADIRNLADSIVNMQGYNPNSSADIFWSQIASSLLSAETALIMATKRNPNFEDVLALHDRLEIQENDLMITTSLDEKFSQLKPDSFGYRAWMSFRSLPIRTAGSAFSSLNVLLDTFTPELRESMRSTESFDVTELGKKRTVLFITTSPVSKSMHAYANVCFASMIKTLFEYAEDQASGALRIPVHFLFDDFACSSTIHNFPELISIFREKGMSATLLVQSLSQIYDLYGDAGAKTIINCCDSNLYFGGGGDIVSAKHVSERANVPVDEVLNMPVGAEWVFRRGTKPMRTRRYPITQDERWQKLNSEYEQSIAALEKDFIPRARPKVDFSDDLIYRPKDNDDVESLRLRIEKRFDEIFGSLTG